MALDDWILAIDFGTSNSAAAHSGATSRGIETLPLTHAGNLMPSAVHVTGPQQISVGDAAVNAALVDPAGFVASPKRLITGAPTCTVGGVTMPTSAPVAAVMSAVIERGKAAHAGQPQSRVVLTHPEAWSGEQIQVLIDAARQAGVDPSRIITVSEPRAAAAHYSRSHAMQPGAKIGVFDFGGGTLDVAVLTVPSTGSGAGRGFQVVAARGDNGLGGKNLDALVQRWVEERLDERDPQAVDWLRTEAPVDVVQAMQDSIRRAKELLSEAPSATITVTTPSGRQTLQITRDELDELIAPAIDQAIRLTRATLLDGGIAHPDQLTALYLTGGSSRIPLVQQRLSELGRVATLDDPKTVVAQGALVVANAENSASTAPHQTATPYPQAPAAAVPAAPAARYPTVPPRPAAQQSISGPVSGPVSAPAGLMTAGASGAGTSNKPWGKIAGGVVALLAVAGIVFGVVKALGSGDHGGDQGGSGGGSTSADAPVTDENTLMAALPSSLRSEVDDCKKSGFSSSQALQIRCDLKADGSLGGLGATDYGYTIEFYVDPNEAGSRIVNIRNGVYSKGKGTLVEDQGRTAAGEIDESVGSSDYGINYVSTANDLIANVYGLKSVDAGKTFLSRSGLIN
ncbi:MAG: Hsp70 family protein [Gordonia sp. (in: high G+C Gram-positive bacteria)]|uniref:Hsp70 family protein n=1 Tax=Gordonia sp. (in: high G+C Gram-positive bacteria) TaxID=84139 RepID=UPI0039E64774